MTLLKANCLPMLGTRKYFFLCVETVTHLNENHEVEDGGKQKKLQYTKLI
jgi:hypothetical protein